MIINVKVNSLNTSIFGTTPVKDGLSVVPSYLMKNPSTDFAIEKDRISNTGIFALASTNTYDSATITSTITLTALEGYFQSTIGKHYLKIRENAILDLVGFEDGLYTLSLELVFVDGGDTELNFHINPSTDPIIGEKLADFRISTYEITLFSLVPVTTIEQSLRDKLDTYNRNEVDEAIKAVADKSALLGGSATQRFKVADAVNDDEALNLGQSDSLYLKVNNSELTNINTMFTNGHYRVKNTATGSPTGRYGAVVVFGNNSNVVTQIFSDFQNANTYVRSYNSSWSNWKRLDNTINTEWQNVKSSYSKNVIYKASEDLVIFHYVYSGDETGKVEVIDNSYFANPIILAQIGTSEVFVPKGFYFRVSGYGDLRGIYRRKGI